jgi:site-specific recombinase XerD
VARPKGTTRAKKPLLKKEFDKLIHAVKYNKTCRSTTKPKLMRAFTLLYLTGCRISEIINFTTTDLLETIKHNEYSLTNATKTKSSRLISFDTNRMQIEILKEIVPTTEIYLFHTNNAHEPMCVASLTRTMNKFIHSVLGELYSTHSFRAGYITAAHQLGLSLEHIRQDIGHASISTTARYATVTNEEIASAKNLRVW